MTPYELLAAMEAGTAPPILDVRSVSEFVAGHIPGAIHIPFHQVGRRAAEVIGSGHEPLVLYCGHGPRAWIAGAALRRRGFRHVSFVKGHMAAWRRARLPEEHGPG